MKKLLSIEEFNNSEINEKDSEAIKLEVANEVQHIMDQAHLKCANIKQQAAENCQKIMDNAHKLAAKVKENGQRKIELQK